MVVLFELIDSLEIILVGIYTDRTTHSWIPVILCSIFSSICCISII